MEAGADGAACGACGSATDRQLRPALLCAGCERAVHADCTARGAAPGDLLGDVFYRYTCAACSPNGAELFLRPKLNWVVIVILATNQLNARSYAISKKGFFHYKTHIASFIGRNWSLLFGKEKQKKAWVGTIAGVLSHFSGIIFESGLDVLGEPGWWKMKHKFSPAVAAHIADEFSRYKLKKRMNKNSNTESMIQNAFEEIITKFGYRDYLCDESENVAIDEDVPNKRRRVDSERSDVSSTEYQQDSDSRNEADEIVPGNFPSKRPDEHVLQNLDGFNTFPNDASTSHPVYKTAYYDSDSRSRSPYTFTQPPDESDKRHTDTEENPSLPETFTGLNQGTLLSKENNSDNEVPWLLHEKGREKKQLVRLNEYEEIQLLKRVETLIPDVTNADDKTHLRRLRAKLALRRLKRNKHLPLFELDQTVKYLTGYSTQDQRNNRLSSERVLDRFQSSYLLDNQPRTAHNSIASTILVGRIEPAPFQSPFSGSMLKPFIRRDSESSPLWLNVMEELLQKTNKNNPEYIPQPRASIDYSYVRPQHIAAINNLCSLFFWPGVDLTESMQYPEFSCVVTYKKLVIGFAFLVPDVRLNEAYISFLLTRPEWRNSKIATFMMYHLLQTCTGKDVVLHVSPTNSAIFLYQKFGFKVEELIQDFYEKYFDITSKECRHALLLRLTR